VRWQVRDKLPKHKLLVFTGPIDAYYASLGMPKLEYRSLRFEKEYHEPEGGYYQEALQVPICTRTHKPSHLSGLLSPARGGEVRAPAPSTTAAPPCLRGPRIRVLFTGAESARRATWSKTAHRRLRPSPHGF